MKKLLIALFLTCSLQATPFDHMKEAVFALDQVLADNDFDDCKYMFWAGTRNGYLDAMIILDKEKAVNFMKERATITYQKEINPPKNK